MIIDKSHRLWIAFSCLVLLFSTALHVLYARSAPDGPTGGSWQGLLFGVAGSAMMLFAGLLSMRKRLPRLPIGTARCWLQAHIWLGLLSVPLILFHANFRWGGLLERALLIVFAVVVVTGVFGLVLQQYLPRLMKSTLQQEAMYEQVPHVCAALRDLADKKVATVCGQLSRSPTGNTVPATAEGWGEEITFREFYLEIVRPYLSVEISDDSPLNNSASAAATFASVQEVLPARLHALLSDLLAICHERRQLASQVRLHRWLHSWLFLHIPLSITLLVLGILHAVTALYY